MEITKLQLEQLASHIINNLKCHCGCTYEESHKEPCACGWTHVADWFEDECDMRLELYPEALKQFYAEYGIEINIKEKK